MKVDGGVFFGGPLEVDFPSPPVVPGHRPGGQVDRRSVQLVGGDVGDAGGGEVPSEIPGGRQPVGDGPACEQEVDFFGGQNPVVDFRVVYFAVEMAGRVFFLAGPDQQGRLVDRRAQIGVIAYGDGVVFLRPFHGRGLMQSGRLGFRIVGGDCEIPGAGMHGLPGGNLLLVVPAVPDPQSQAAFPVQHHPVSGGVGRTPFGQNDLRPPAGGGGVNPGQQRETRFQVKDRTVGDRDIGPDVDFLHPARIGAVGRRVQQFLLDPGPVRVAVGVDEPHQLRGKLGRPATDLKPDSLPGLGPQPVPISHDFHSRLLSKAQRTPPDYRRPNPAPRPPPQNFALGARHRGRRGRRSGKARTSV